MKNQPIEPSFAPFFAAILAMPVGFIGLMASRSVENQVAFGLVAIAATTYAAFVALRYEFSNH